MNLKSVFGLDGFDLAIQAAVTFILMFWVVEVNNGKDIVIFNSMVASTSLIVLAVRRKLALRRSTGQIGLTSGEMAAERMDELEQRMADLEAASVRIAELEERLDFAERLLARPAEQRALPSESGR